MIIHISNHPLRKEVGPMWLVYSKSKEEVLRKNNVNLEKTYLKDQVQLRTTLNKTPSLSFRRGSENCPIIWNAQTRHLLTKKSCRSKLLQFSQSPACNILLQSISFWSLYSISLWWSVTSQFVIMSNQPLITCDQPMILDRCVVITMELIHLRLPCLAAGHPQDPDFGIFIV